MTGMSWRVIALLAGLLLTACALPLPDPRSPPAVPPVQGVQAPATPQGGPALELPMPPPLVLGPDGVACASPAPAALPGLVPIEDAALVTPIVLPAGKGGACHARAFRVEAPLTVHRIFDSRYPQSAMGRWWTFDVPQGSREDYRNRFAICPEWSQLDRVITCQLKVGAHLVLGSTQSARCEDGWLAVQPSVQVYVPNDNMRDRFLVEHCSPAAPWPPGP